MGIRLICIGLLVLIAPNLFFDGVVFIRWLRSDYVHTAAPNVWAYQIIHLICLGGMFVGSFIGYLSNERARKLLVALSIANLMDDLVLSFPFSVKYRGLSGAARALLASPRDLYGIFLVSFIVIAVLTPRPFRD